MKLHLTVGAALILGGVMLANAQDRDNDGLPDSVDRTPTVQRYFHNQANPQQVWLDMPESMDYDRDGLADRFDSRPTVLEYFRFSAPVQKNYALQSPTEDTDGDGLPDRLDRTPTVLRYFHLNVTPWTPRNERSGTLDTDGDGWVDQKDDRPTIYEVYKGISAPVAQAKTDGDADGDGVVDSRDKCPNTPAGTKVDEDGCPLDSDKDGVADNLDKCPNTPANTEVDESGCPKVADSDNDGVIDIRDKCPNTPVGTTVDADGCPMDSDGDGVADNLDKCPGTPKGIEVDETGCPKIIKKGEKIILNVEFATNSADPDAKSQEILNGVAKTMTDYPEIKLQVRGFTDNVGAEGYNKRLSERRAKAVMDYLVAKGVDKGRLTSKGFGEDPQYFIGDNNTDDGRQKNRRVELESVE